MLLQAWALRVARRRTNGSKVWVAAGGRQGLTEDAEGEVEAEQMVLPWLC